MTSTSDKILKAIKDTKIQPRPRWEFLAKNFLLWAIFWVALIISSLSFAVIVSLLVNHDWDIYENLHKSFLQYLVSSLPYIWIVCVAIASWIAYFNYVHTKGWYKHRVHRVVLASVLASMGLGTLFYVLGFGKGIDEALSNNFPYYTMMSVDRKQLWCHPAEGLLGGIVESVDEGQAIKVVDYNGAQWNVEVKKAKIQNTDLEPGERVKIIGREKNSNTFEAKEIREWEVKDKKSQRKGKNDDVCTMPNAPCSQSERENGREDD